jgi:signal transduction histidine kinase
MSTDSGPMPMAADDDRGVHDELLQLLARQGRRVPIPVFFADALVAWTASARVAGAWPWLWLGLVAAMLLVRWRVLGALPHASRLTLRERLGVAVALSGLNGVLHSASVMFAGSFGDTQMAIQTIVLLGLCVGAVGTTAGYMPVFAAFAAPTILALSGMWLLHPSSDPLRTQLSITLLIAMFGMILVALARDAQRLFIESFEIRQQQRTLNQQLQQALDAAGVANTAKTRFLASASHDLRQPMHALTLYSAALGMSPLDNETRRISGKMSAAIQTLGAQLDTLLDVSKLDAGVVLPKPVTFELQPLLDRVELAARPLAEAKGLAFSIQCPPSVVS